ncbi:Syntaxin/t-SNARE family protein [Melia azedarach]|uniref:Syntaxin/t-SNARE family protein n=1 Tax=Melia azedarach TaxID=155640 RepID=A0ACC1XDE9_MELAZ|nr:Syntaxin/t-SNARE family protein [Melia azedarach]
MMVANTFDLWKKDSFFSAAEEVQESADIMESAYRLWARERREGLKAEYLDELSRELQTALGTAKWQLDEFEKAVRLSHRHSYNDNTTARHMQFIAAIENQISLVEAALRQAFSEEGKQPLRWVNLDEEERDDLAMFLSGNSSSSSTGKDESIKFIPSVKSSLLENNRKKRDARLNPEATCTQENSNELTSCKDAGSIDKNRECVIQIEDESPGTKDDTIGKSDRATGTRRTWSSPNFASLKIAIANENGEASNLMAFAESTPKEKGSKLVFWKHRCIEHRQAKGAINLFNQLFVGFQRQRQSPVHLQLNRSVQLMLIMMLTIFLIVPFVLYST